MYQKGIYSYLFLGKNFIRKQLEWHTSIVYFPSHDYVLIYFLYLFMGWMQRRKMLSILELGRAKNSFDVRMTVSSL